MSSVQDWIDRDFVAYHAGVRPNKTACIALKTGERVNYGDLHVRSDRAAAAILALAGDVRGLAVSYLARNSIDYLAFVMGCYRTGAVLQPLNWRLSAAELEVLVLDAGPVLVVYEEEFAGPLLEAMKSLPHVRTLSTPEFEAEVAAAAEHPFTSLEMAPDAPFVLLYTSGTTGKPKGAIISRRNIFWESYNFAAASDAGVESLLLCDSPMFHTVGLVAVAWTSLQKGATFAISDRFVPSETLARLLDDDLLEKGRGATHYFGVPQIARMLMDDPAYRPRALNRLTGFFLGGAPMPLDLTERMLADDIKVANGFGMSETGTIMHIPRDLAVIRRKPASVGLPTPAMQVRIADENGDTVPDGVHGELVMRGPAVTRGYWRRPETTAEAFFGDWFRSGDIGMRDSDGFFYVLDRSKDMYISGGENVYPAEVETAILRIPGVAEAAVIGTPDERWGEVGCAYVALKPGVEMDAKQIIDGCSQWLATYKRPKHVRFIDAVPRNAAGKAQKAILRQRPL
ncbi:MAG: AMP-binding protein [Caulobacteraceae bacterium]